MPKINHLTRFPVYSVSLLVAGLGAYSLLNLAKSGLWLDELSSLFFAEARHSLWFLYSTRMIQDTSPPLYYVVLHYWIVLLSDDETIVRLLSWLLAAGAAIVTYQFGKKLYSRQTAFLLAAMLYCTPGLVQYGLESRAYSMLILLSTGLVLQAIILCERFDKGMVPGKASLAGFITLGLLTSLTHYFGLLLYAVLGIYVYRVSRCNRAVSRRVLLYGIDSLLLYALWVLSTWYGMQHRLGAASGRTLSADLIPSLHAGIVTGFGHIIIAGALIVPVVIAGIKYGRRYLGQHGFLVPLAGIVGISTISWLISLHTPILSSRNYLVLVPMMLIMFLHAMSMLIKENAIAWAGMVVCCALAYNSAERVTAIKSEMREAAQFIASQENCDSGRIIAVPALGRGTHHFRYYLPAVNLQLITGSMNEGSEALAGILDQECRVVMWIMHWTDKSDYFLRKYGMQNRKLEAHRFIGTTVYTRS